VTAGILVKYKLDMSCGEFSEWMDRDVKLQHDTGNVTAYAFRTERGHSGWGTRDLPCISTDK